MTKKTVKISFNEQEYTDLLVAMAVAIGQLYHLNLRQDELELRTRLERMESALLGAITGGEGTPRHQRALEGFKTLEREQP